MADLKMSIQMLHAKSKESSTSHLHNFVEIGAFKNVKNQIITKNNQFRRFKNEECAT